MTTTQTRRPDASMTLLREMTERPMDPGYAAEAARRKAAGLPASTGLRTWRLGAAAVALGLLFSVSAIHLNRDASSVAKTKVQLINQIDEARAGTQSRSARINALQQELSAAESRHGDDVGGRLRTLEEATGALAVTGPGYVITVDDAPASGIGGGTDDDTSGKVVSKDLQIIVNSLWASGAEAVMINGERLSAKSPIRFAGEAILVNFRPLTRPYVITAIGDPRTLPSRFGAGTGGTYLNLLRANFGISATTATKDSVVLPGATALTVRVAKPDKSTTNTSRNISPNAPTAKETAK